jgi:methylmalonyl-CoA mutase N-terminal domain/subunit
LREQRDNGGVEAALVALESAAHTGRENLLPHILVAVESYATVGEISHRLRRVWGEYREAVTV